MIERSAFLNLTAAEDAIASGEPFPVETRRAQTWRPYSFRDGPEVRKTDGSPQ